MCKYCVRLKGAHEGEPRGSRTPPSRGSWGPRGRPLGSQGTLPPPSGANAVAFVALLVFVAFVRFVASGFVAWVVLAALVALAGLVALAAAVALFGWIDVSSSPSGSGGVEQHACGVR